MTTYWRSLLDIQLNAIEVAEKAPLAQGRREAAVALSARIRKEDV
jgi:hypothetical protein